jgi:muramidase (phage lysozyme)
MDRTVPAAAARLLDFIGSIEAPRGYTTIYGNNQSKLTKPITEMTLDELIENQRGFTANFRSSASGRYQFMRNTLLGLKTELKLTGQEKFTPDFQDRLGYALLRRRGYTSFISGRMGRTAFGLNLAKEWASFPVLEACRGAHRNVPRGSSYYAGDALNKSLVSPARVEAVLDSCLLLAQGKSVPDLAKELDKGVKADAAKGTAAGTGGAAAGGGGVASLDPATFDWSAWLFVGFLFAVAALLLYVAYRFFRQTAAKKKEAEVLIGVRVEVVDKADQQWVKKPENGLPAPVAEKSDG